MAGSRNLDARMVFSWKQLMGILFIYRVIFAIAGQLVIAKLTQLGDAGSYQQGTFQSTGSLFDSNIIVANIGAAFYYPMFGSRTLINVCFQGLAFFGMYRLVKSLPSESRIFLVLLMFLPTFTLWSSVAGKEPVLVFAVSNICATFVAYLRGKIQIGPLFLVSMYLVFVMKTHYYPGLLFFLGAVIVLRNFKYPSAIVMMVGIFSLLPLYVYRKFINTMSFEIINHFSGFGNSTRVAFWVDEYDVFWKAPEGIFQGFIGPNFIEAFGSGKVLQTVTYLEGMALLLLLVTYIFYDFGRVPFFNFVTTIFSLFWMLFPNYPFGIMNSGSAIRYRTGFLIFIFFLFVFVRSRNLYVSGRSSHRKQKKCNIDTGKLSQSVAG
jgi:hypothetical protein